MPEAQRARDSSANIQTETVRLQNIIDRLLALSAIEARKTLDVAAPGRPGETGAPRVRRSPAGGRDRKAARDLSLRLDDKPVVQGEEFLLEMAVANLLQNAIDFSPARNDGTITVTLTETADWRARPGCRSTTSGAGVPNYARDRVFDRFYSLQHPDTGRKSSGLGLCFVREAAELHGGSAKLEDRATRRHARHLRAAVRAGDDQVVATISNRQPHRARERYCSSALPNLCSSTSPSSTISPATGYR